MHLFQIHDHMKSDICCTFWQHCAYSSTSTGIVYWGWLCCRWRLCSMTVSLTCKSMWMAAGWLAWSMMMRFWRIWRSGLVASLTSSDRWVQASTLHTNPQSDNVSKTVTATIHHCIDAFMCRLRGYSKLCDVSDTSKHKIDCKIGRSTCCAEPQNAQNMLSADVNDNTYTCSHIKMHSSVASCASCASTCLAAKNFWTAFKPTCPLIQCYAMCVWVHSRYRDTRHNPGGLHRGSSQLASCNSPCTLVLLLYWWMHWLCMTVHCDYVRKVFHYPSAANCNDCVGPQEASQTTAETALCLLTPFHLLLWPRMRKLNFLKGLSIFPSLFPSWGTFCLETHHFVLYIL